MDSLYNFASLELKKYWKKIADEDSSDIILINKGIEELLQEHYNISIKQGRGCIVGDNYRSLLLGVYHFLREIGCLFLLPGESGEYIPKLKKENISVCLDFKPSYHHRGITLEGSCSEDHVLKLIDWSVKNGFNSYFIQFRTGYTFFERWYSHNFNPYADIQVFNDEIAEKINKNLQRAIEDRGMLYHAVGHGWTCEPFGIPSRGWDDNIQFPEKFSDYFAQINGKREFFKGIPLNTNLCYSNPTARKFMVDNIVDYAKNHLSVNILHVWLGDNWNNYCECDQCRQKTPSDWYVILLNEIDDALTKEGLSTKIVFLAYFELLFAPQTEKIINQDRFILMFAPITRTYDNSWCDQIEKAYKTDLPQLSLNNFQPPVDTAENIAHLIRWQKMFKGDSFVFDYPLMWDICKEYGGIKLAKTIYEDIHSLDKINLGGYISCQIQRCFFPTGFAMFIMANSLYDTSKSFDQLKDQYFNCAFGKHGLDVYNILEELSSFRIYTYMKNEIKFSDSQMHDEIPTIRERISKFINSISLIMKEDLTPFVLRNFALVEFILNFVYKLTFIIEEKSSKNVDERKIEDLRRELQLWVFSKEPQFEQFADCSYLYTHVDEMTKRK